LPPISVCAPSRTARPSASTRKFIVALRPQWQTAFNSISESASPSSAADPSNNSP
jgi:hypothetical protein